MIGFTETIYLFYALAGLCVGWLWGAFYGVLTGIGASLGGCTLGFVFGFLAARAPQEVNVATARISRKHKLLGTLFAISGHLVWLGLSITFWWLWASLLRRRFHELKS